MKKAETALVVTPEYRQFFLAYSCADFLGQAVPEMPAARSSAVSASRPLLDLLKEIPWGQNLLILKKLTDPTARQLADIVRGEMGGGV